MIFDDIMLYATSIIFALILAFFCVRKEFEFSKLFRLIYLLPFTVAMIYIERQGLTIYLLPLYIGIILVSACYFIADKKKKFRRTICFVAVSFMIIGILVDITHPDFRRKTYVDEYKKVFQVLKENYVLGDYKEIDWDKTYEEYLVLFEEADQEQSEALMYEAWSKFAHSFHDGHIYFWMKSNQEILSKEYAEKCAGYDYGFCLVSFSDGSVHFVNVDENSSAYEQGIRDGKQILAIDNKDITEFVEDSYVYFYEFPDKENETFFKPLFATANCGEEITVTFIDENNKEQSAIILGQGNNYERMKMTRAFLLGVSEEEPHNNLYTEMLSEHVGYLVINDMEIEESVRYGDEESEAYSGLAKQIGKQIGALKEQGATKIILDMRDNHGGYLEAAMELASYFTDEPLFAGTEGKEIDHTNTYESVYSVYSKANNIWGEGEIVILVNAKTISAGELFIHMMKQLPNVTVMGFTKSCGSAMAITEYETNNLTIAYPEMILLDENGEVMIDSSANRVMKMEPDILIPFDEKAFESIFIDGEDYVLEYAIDYLDGK